MKAVINHCTPEDISRNHDIFLGRTALYKKYGLDLEETRTNIVGQLPNDIGTVLEIGTGKGYLTTMLARHFKKIVSVDIDSGEHRIAMLNAAYYKQLDKIEFVTADAAGLDFTDRSFDAVVSAFTFHHLDFPFKVIREIMRLAGRQVVISDFNSHGFEIIERVHQAEGKTHLRKPGDFEIVGVFLEEHNFDVRTIEYECQTVYSAQRKVRL